MGTICAHCGEELRFEAGKGYVHQDGGLYAQRRITEAEAQAFERRHGRRPRNGEWWVDDHCALAVPGCPGC